MSGRDAPSGRGWQVLVLAVAVTAAAVACATAGPPPADGARAAPALAVSSATIRAAARGQGETWAFVTIVNRGPADALVGATSPDAGAVVLRAVRVADAGRLARSVLSIPVPAHGELAMSADTWLLAFADVRRALVPGDSVAATLRFARGTVLPVRLTVVEGGDN
jgi:copper(I)-binding protein